MNPHNGWQCHPLRALSMWWISALFIILQFFLQLSIGIISTQLRIDLTLDAIGLSLLASSYYIVYVALQIPAGFFIDLFGVRRLLTFGGLVCTIGCILFATTNQLSVAILGRVLMGGGLAFAFIGSLSLAKTWFPLRYYILMVGAAETVAMIGAFSGNLFLESMLSLMSWQKFYLVLTVFIALLSLIAWLVVRDSPANAGEPSHEFDTNKRIARILSNIKVLLKLPIIWLLGLYCGLCYTVVTVFGALWGIPFLTKAHQLSHYDATIACSILFVGMGLSAPYISWKFSHHPYRKHFMITAPILLTLILAELIFGPQLSVPIIFIMTTLLGVLCGGLIITYTMATQFSPIEARNTCLGVINTFALGVTPISISLIGLILDLQSDVVSKHDIEIYTPTNYRAALVVLPISMIIAALIGLFLPKDDARN